MTLWSVPIDEVSDTHLRGLVDNEVAELRAIEYKRDLPGPTSDDKKEFLADVSSFANANGGDLVYGVIEENGILAEVPGFEAADIDAVVLRLEALIRDGISPRIQGLTSQPVPLPNGRHALVVRVPRSFSRPHVVTLRNHWKFFTRSSAGKHQMDVDEVRGAFLGSEAVR
jgi:predicted HTH transcriptional regulator